jgi:hypothetical protein
MNLTNYQESEYQTRYSIKSLIDNAVRSMPSPFEMGALTKILPDTVIFRQFY